MDLASIDTTIYTMGVGGFHREPKDIAVDTAASLEILEKLCDNSFHAFQERLGNHLCQI